jgi:hypothetical protein
MRPPRPLLAIGFLVCASASSPWWGASYGRAWTWWYTQVIDHLEQRFEIEPVAVVEDKGERFFQARFVLANPAEIGGRPVPRGAAVVASTLLAHALVHPIIMASMLFCAGLWVRVNTVYLLSGGLGALALIETLDVPLVLLGSLHVVLAEVAAPERFQRQFLMPWAAFMTNGGRLGLALALSLLVIAVSSRRRPAAG